MHHLLDIPVGQIPMTQPLPHLKDGVKDRDLMVGVLNYTTYIW